MAADIPGADLRILLRDAFSRVHIQHRQISRHVQEDAEEALPGAGLHQRGVGLVLHLAARVEDKPGLWVLRREGDLPVLPGDGDSVCGLLDGIQSKAVCVVIVVYIEAAGESCEQQDRRGGEQESPAKRRSFFRK